MCSKTLGCVRRRIYIEKFYHHTYYCELVDMIQGENCNGVYINENVSNQIILLYADDISVGSDTVGMLQKVCVI